VHGGSIHGAIAKPCYGHSVATVGACIAGIRFRILPQKDSELTALFQVVVTMLSQRVHELEPGTVLVEASLVQLLPWRFWIYFWILLLAIISFLN